MQELRFTFRTLVNSDKRKTALACAAAMMFCTHAAQAHAQNIGKDTLVPVITLDTLLAKVMPQQKINLENIKAMNLADAQAITAFYEAREGKPAWTDTRDHGRAQAILAVLDQAWQHGLNPDHYHVSEIRALLAGESAEKQGQLDILLSDAVLRYGRDVGGIRINPAPLGLSAKYWRQPPEGLGILQNVSAGPDPATALSGLAPQDKFYKALRDEMVRLANDESAYDGILPLKFGGALLKPGQRHSDIVKLRMRFDLTHDPENGPENLYDEELSAAVMAFQEDHGLTPDGVIGPKTLMLLNRSRRDRMEQVVANLERLRWLDQEKPERYILVNIPSQMLWAVENGEVKHEMRVVVGQVARQTKAFKAEITGIRFNPTWTVPLNIKMKDFLPKLRENPAYLSDRNMKLTRVSGKSRETVNPEDVDWENVGWKDMNQFSMVQSPGVNNALGHIRVLMPNDYDIYLHDTNHRELFVKDERLLSSGCVRLSEPETIARFVLEKNEGWSEEKMKAALDGGKLTEVPVAKPFPVYIVYQSMWVDKDGELVYGPDVYKQDKKLLEVLAAKKAYRLPGDDSEQVAKADNSALTAVQ